MFDKIKKVENALFVNNARDHVVLRFIDVDDFAHEVSIGVNSPNMEKLLKIVPMKKIEENTYKEINRQKREQEAQRKMMESQRKKNEIEALHNIKQELYNIKPVKTSANKRLKKELRVAETPERARLIASMILIDNIFDLGELDIDKLKEINQVD